MAPVIAEVISNRLEDWNRAHCLPINYWPEFIHLIQSRINPLCTEAVLRETVQFLQYTGDVSHHLIFKPALMFARSFPSLKDIRQANVAGEIQLKKLV